MASENDDAGDFDKLARRYLDLWQSQLAQKKSSEAAKTETEFQNAWQHADVGRF